LMLRKGVEYLRDVMAYDQNIQKKPGKLWVELTLRKGVEYLRDVMVYDQNIQKKNREVVTWVDVEEWSGVFTRCNGLWPKHSEKNR
jgi:hypothetical protein